MGKETIPVLFGKARTLTILKIISLILFIVLLVSYPWMDILLDFFFGDLFIIYMDWFYVL
jgi:hypothetical protein